MATVLVVEDDKLSQRILQKILTGAQHTALLTSSVEEAWEALRQSVAVDLVILDNQLGRSWGWRFLEDLRQDVLFKELPVVIYTGHTERSSILRYVELGVTSMLVKPYKAETVYDEVNKAVKTNWTGKLLEKPDEACARLRISEGDYYSVLSAGASALEKTMEEMGRALSGKRGAPQAVDVLQQFYNQSVSLGMPALRTTADALAKAVANQNSKVIHNCLQAIDCLRTLLRNRALAYVGIGEVTTSTTPPIAAPVRTATDSDATAPAAHATDFFRRKLASLSILKLGPFFERLSGNRLFTAEDWATRVDEMVKQPLFAELCRSARFIEDAASSASMDELETGIKRVLGFEKIFLDIVNRLASRSEADDADPDLSIAINRLGLHKTVILLAAARLAPALRPETPLDLEPLRTHTLCSMVLAYEIARMLRLPDEPLTAAAGATHTIGTWAFAVTEPALYAAAVAWADATHRPTSETEREIFGYSHHELGNQLLAGARMPEPLQAAAAHYAQPSTEPNSSHHAMIAAVKLADEIAATLATQQDTLIDQLKTRLLAPGHPTWRVMTKNRVELPMDLPEFVDMLLTAGKTSLWIATLLLPLELE